MVHKMSHQTLLLVLSMCLAVFCCTATAGRAQAGTDFAGTVLKIDAAAGKVAVKKDEGGTRFTFVVHEKTQFGSGLKSLADLKTGDHVVVNYVVKGSQYLAESIARVAQK
jgi:Cu/Ag efflux protein CusF